MLLAAIAIAVGVPILWAMSVGSLREIRRLRTQDPPWTGCPAWVRVRGVPGRRYRCATPCAPGGALCPQHEALARRGALHEPDGIACDEPAAVGRALAQLRLAVAVVLVVLAATLLAVGLSRR